MNDQTHPPRPAPANAFAQAKVCGGKGAVYLAETTSDLHEQREEIKSELEQHDYEVLPDKVLPLLSPAYERAVEDCLKRARLSVHLLGARYAAVPEGADGSISQLQIKLAIQRRDDPAFARLIWMPPDLQATDTRQQSFIRDLQADSETQKLADLRIEKLADLKTFLLKKLTPIRQEQKIIATMQTGNGHGGPETVYLIYNAADQDEAQMAEEYLFDYGYEVFSSRDWSKKSHESFLKLCDSLLIYHGKGNDGWLNERRADLIHARGLREGKKFHAKAFYLSEPPETEIKKRFRSNDALVIRSSNGFDLSKLAEFINEINRAKGATI